MLRRLVPRAVVVSLFLTATVIGHAGCGSGSNDDTLQIDDGDFVKSDDKADSSAEAVFVDFEFDGEVWVGSAYNPERIIRSQLLYLIGQLNGNRSVPRLNEVDLTDVKTQAEEDKIHITYHARLPVAWGKVYSRVPVWIKLYLPREMGMDSTMAFAKKYGRSCIEVGAHDVDSRSMWYYFRPEEFGCNLEEVDTLTTHARVSVSSINTTGKYPEYHKVWEDNVLKVVAVFGKFDSGATTNDDDGISEYNEFLNDIATDLSDFDPVKTPADAPANPGVEAPDITFEATLPDGKQLLVTSLLVDSVGSAGASFDARYESLSSEADLIAYNGHSAFGDNIRALARKGQWVEGQYVIVFLNGCDTYAYLDSAIWDAHVAVNPDDETGTKYSDIVTNAMPSPVDTNAESTMSLISGLMSYDDPMTYEAIFATMNNTQVVLVSGEEDNVFFAGYTGEGEDPVQNWSGLDDEGSIGLHDEVRLETPDLPAGSYRFEMTGTGDCDLHVRIGIAPTTTRYDCRPFKAGSNETCDVDLGSPAPIHVMIRGWKNSDYVLTGSIQ